MRTHLFLLLLLTDLISASLVAPADPITIMPLGDSITVGVNSTDGSGYRDPLYNDLKGTLSFKFVGSTTAGSDQTLINAGDQYHNGYGHYQIPDITANLKGDVQPVAADDNEGGHWLSGANSNPNIILLLIGTNDFLQQNYANIDTNITNLVSALPSTSKILIAGTIPILADSNQPPFSPVGNVGFNTLITAYDSYIQTTLTKEFPNVTYVDQYSNFITSNGTLNTSLYSSDGIHPDDAGYAAIANTWDQAILAAEAPEPGALPLLGAGALALFVFIGRRKKIRTA